MCLAQGWILRRELNGIEGARLVSSVIRITAAAALLGAVSYFTWKGLDEALGRSLAGQAVSVLTGDRRRAWSSTPARSGCSACPRPGRSRGSS